MLSFHVSAQDQITIYCDAKGMSALLGALATLVGERASHTHLMAAPLGNGELSEKTPFGDDAVREVIINYAEGD